MKLINRSLLLFGIFDVVCCTSLPKSDSSANPIFFRNISEYEGPKFNELHEMWKFKAEMPVRATPLLYSGKIYFGGADSNFYCIDKKGKEIWRIKAEASIESSAAAESGKVYFGDRSNNLYAVSSSDGNILWKVNLGNTLPYDWGFDYYQSSPLIYNDILYVGSGDGNFYALEKSTGNVKWKFAAGAIIRSSASVSNDVLYFGDVSGKLFAIDANTGQKKWMFHTIGDTLNNEDFGFDRKAIIGSPVIKDNIVVVGGRDGYLYAVDAQTGKEAWNFDFDVSWVITSVAIKDTIIVAGTSDGKFVNALNLKTGKEIWRSASSLVWSSPIIVSNTVVSAANDGFIYLHELHSGKEIKRFRAAGDRFFSSPVYDEGNIYIGNDDGNLYTFSVSEEVRKTNNYNKAVFWIKDPIYQYHKYGIDIYLKDYFVAEGYQLLDEEKLADFLSQRILDSVKSVIVFASNYFPESAVSEEPKGTLIQQYLKKGGKIVVTGLNPSIFAVDYKNRAFQGYDYSRSENIIGFSYPYKDLRSHKGFFASGLTDEGKKWGMTATGISNSGVDPNRVLPLSIDENGNAACWVKNYGGPTGTGFVQLWLNPSEIRNVSNIKEVAEFGIIK